MQTSAVAYPADVPRGRKADREELSVVETIVGWRGSLPGILSQLQAVAPTNTTVLLAGETGTGKEFIARAIHELSRRRGRNLVKVSCAAMPVGLLETELFGPRTRSVHRGNQFACGPVCTGRPRHVVSR